ncbi:hypothetical protein ACLB2K_028752 [Fragaria x ananassa]
MSSSQRAESQHSFFKDYVSQWNTLVEFMVQFRRGLLHQRNHELREDHINIEEKVKTAMSLDIEDDMAKVIVSDEASQLLMESLDAFLEKFNRLSNGNLAPVLETETPTIQHVFNEPDEVRAKGCGKRLRKGKAKESQSRKSHGCGLYGQSHDKRNCPRLLAK